MFRTTNSRERRARREAQERAAAPAPPRPAARALRPDQEGYTLAALIVILTIIAIIIAYTVPTQWSLVMRRERERQTIFLMKQFARGIENWERKHSSSPVSLDQLQEARQPRMLRGTGKWAMPLTGSEKDWILVPPQAIEAAGGGTALQPGGQRGVGIGQPRTTPSAGTNPQQPQQPGAMSPPSKLNPDASPKDYVGPFVAVRPNAKGPSLLSLNGAEDYSQWVYTVQDLRNERLMLQTALSVPK